MAIIIPACLALIFYLFEIHSGRGNPMLEVGLMFSLFFAALLPLSMIHMDTREFDKSLLLRIRQYRELFYPPKFRVAVLSLLMGTGLMMSSIGINYRAGFFPYDGILILNGLICVVSSAYCLVETNEKYSYHRMQLALAVVGISALLSQLYVARVAALDNSMTEQWSVFLCITGIGMFLSLWATIGIKSQAYKLKSKM